MGEKFDAGLKKRKKVLGENYVNSSFENANDFNKPFQEFLTETYWGGVWDRNGIDDKTKSIVTLSVLIALRAEHEIAIHTKGALNNGVTPEELMAILIHSSAYAGAPAAVSAEKVIRKTLEDSGNIS
jgi:4-carboxymuconolactone decarboxylase